jgi:hypothetical protein
VALRLFHPTMRASEITMRLGLRPHVAWTAGEDAPTHTTDGEMIPRRSTYWTRPLRTGRGQELPAALAGSARDLRRHRRWLKKFHETGGRVEYFIFIGLKRRDNFGVTLTRALFEELNELGIDLALDLYGPDE